MENDTKPRNELSRNAGFAYIFWGDLKITLRGLKLK